MFPTFRSSAKKLLVSAWADFPGTQSTRLSHTEVRIPVPWGHIAGKWWNKDDRRPILAVHGWLDNANSFDKLAPLMSSKLPVLAIDLPGHGQSSHFPHGFPYHRLTAVATLQRIAEFFGWKKVSLIGHSLGGQTCFLYACIYPELVDSLVTLDILAPVPINVEKYVKGGGKIIDDFIRRESFKPEDAPSYAYEKLVTMVVNSPVTPIVEESGKILLERGSVRNESGKYLLTRDLKLKGPALTGWSPKELLKFCLSLKTNVLCVKAESSPYFSTKEFFEECWTNVTSAAKNAELKYLPGDHHFHMHDAQIVAPVVNDFLSKYYSLEMVAPK